MTVTDFAALGPTPLPQVMVKVVEVVSAPVFLLPLAAGVATPTLLSMEQVMVPPPVTPLQLRLVFPPFAMLEEVGMNEPMATFARHIPAVLPQVLPEIQLAEAVLVSRVVVPFFKLKTVCGYATQIWRPGDDFEAAEESVTPVLASTSEGFSAFAVVHVAEIVLQVEAPAAMVQLRGVRVRAPVGAAETVIGVHVPQLFPVLASEMEPPHDVLKLAHARTLYVPADEKVYEPETVVESLTASIKEIVSALTFATVAVKLLLAI